MIKVVRELSKLTREFDFVNCLETGTIRSYNEKHESTFHISNIIGNNGKLKSIDIEQKSIDISKDIFNNAKNVEWIMRDSIKYLEGDKDWYHFVLLDSVNNPDHILNEFRLVVEKIYQGGVLMIDDAGVDFDKNPTDDGSPHSPRKAILVNELLSNAGADYTILQGGHPGNQLFLKMSQDNLSRIKESL